jgi:hypothetical protein
MQREFTGRRSLAWKSFREFVMPEIVECAEHCLRDDQRE